MPTWLRQLLKTLRHIVVVSIVCAYCVSAPLVTYEQNLEHLQTGIASFYGNGKDGFLGRKTASGYVLTAECLYAAHPTLPFGTELLITNLKTGLSVVVTVRDRGPFVRGRIIDLSHKAAKLIGMQGTDIVSVMKIIKTPVVIDNL